MNELVYHVDARRELVDVAFSYERISDELWERFLAEVRRVEVRLRTTRSPGVNYDKDTRFVRLKRFPYADVFLQVADKIHVVAITMNES